MHHGNKERRILTGLLTALLSFSCSFVASAASPNTAQGDYFGRSTEPAPSASRRPHKGGAAVRVQQQTDSKLPKLPPLSTKSSPTEWFETYDILCFAYRASNEEKAILQKPLQQDVERINQFCSTVARLARNYRVLAKRIRALPIPTAMPEAKMLIDHQATWYEDSALVYEDMIRPRTPARTQEELQNMISEVDQRADALKSTQESLVDMDREYRKRYQVHAPREDDSLYKYTSEETR